MKKYDFLFLCDFETTGVDPDVHYPIELGGLLIDNCLNIIDVYHALIKVPKDAWDLFYREHDHKYTVVKSDWIEPHDSAYSIHGITVQELMQFGKEPIDVCSELLSFLNRYRKYGRVIITSDNAQFEFNFMKKLFKMANMLDQWPFHYSAWDTNLDLCLFAPDIGDAIPVHRALPDAFRLYRQLVRYAERIKFFERCCNDS